MSRLVRALAAILILAFSPPLLAAEPSPLPPTALVEAHDEVIAFASVSAEIAMICIAGGGLIMNAVAGDVASILAGAMVGYVVGSTLASWAFLSRISRNYIIQRVGPDGNR